MCFIDMTKYIHSLKKHKLKKLSKELHLHTEGLQYPKNATQACMQITTHYVLLRCKGFILTCSSMPSDMFRKKFKSYQTNSFHHIPKQNEFSIKLID